MNARIASVDFLRGLTIILMILVNNPGSWSYVYAPLLHAKWHGLTFADLVFPFFLYIIGISIALVYREKRMELGMFKKILTRSLKLIVLGLFLNAFLPYFPFFESFNTLRIPGVLQRIGVVFFITSILYIICSKAYFITLIIASLILYWVWLVFVPLPDNITPTLDRSTHNWANYIDVLFLKGHLWKHDYDPEGVLSTIPSIATACIGSVIGRILISYRKNKHFILLTLGIALLITGYIWDFTFPINKAIWTSSFVLVTAGYATIVLAFLYYIQDEKKIQIGNIIKAVGANSILIYFLSIFIAKSFYLITIKAETSIHHWLFETFLVYDFLSLKFSSFIYAILVVCFYLIVAYLLHKKKVFIKV
nr:heparan-alpha-glucosaminide N-acetyltransferase [Aquimarina sp. AU474]